jgi:Mor family transcriptional regulator
VGRPRSPAVAVRDEEIHARWISREYATFGDLAKVYGLTSQRIGQIVAAKEAEIYRLWRTGKFTLADLAERYELTPEDISGIVARKHPEQQDEGVGRAVLRSRIELLMIAIQEVIENPGYKLAPNGRLAEDEDGNPLVDIGARIEAMKLQLNAYERAARLEGADKQVAKAMDRPTAEAAMWEAIHAERRRLEDLVKAAAGDPRVVPGEIVRELPPGSAQPH